MQHEIARKTSLVAFYSLNERPRRDAKKSGDVCIKDYPLSADDHDHSEDCFTCDESLLHLPEASIEWARGCQLLPVGEPICDPIQKRRVRSTPCGGSGTFESN